MSKIIKTEREVCPKCGNWDTERIDFEFDIDCFSFKMSCKECDAVWREYALLKYDGYYDTEERIMYDADGKRCSD